MHAGLRFPLQYQDFRMARHEIRHGGAGDARANDHRIESAPITHELDAASDRRATTVVAARSPVTLPMVANASGIVSTASISPSGATGSPIACTTGMFIAIRLTWPGSPTEPRLITTASAAPMASWAAERSTP